MATSAPTIKYRDEFIATFEETETLLANTCVRETMKEGLQATFLTAGSNDEVAVTRGLNGLIPASNNYMAQTTATLEEWHHLVQQTRFNIFQSQGPQTALMQRKASIVLNKKIDDLILTQLLAGTLTWNGGSATTGNIANVSKAIGILGNNEVRTQEEDNMFAVVSPSFMAYLRQTPEFASADYVNVKTWTGGVKKMLRWAGVNWIVHPNVSGVGTATERCFMWHRDAMGLAFDTTDVGVEIGYNGEHDYSWARASAFVGAKLLQNTGIVEMTHDGSAIGLGA